MLDEHGKRAHDPGLVGVIAVVLTLVMYGCARTGAGGEPDASASAENIYTDYPPAKPQRCIDTRTIRRIEPVGDHTLLFYMRNGDVWRNRLDQPCPGMREDTIFSYEVRTGKLCSTAVVHQLERVFDHFQQGFTCLLGEFDYLTEDQAEAVRNFD